MESRIAALEERLERLEAEFSTRARASMRESLRCPMCGCRRLYRATDRPQQEMLMYITRSHGFIKSLVGPVECDVCSKCGFAELHVDVEKFDASETTLQIIEGDPADDKGPYR